MRYEEQDLAYPAHVSATLFGDSALKKNLSSLAAGIIQLADYFGKPGKIEIEAKRPGRRSRAFCF